MSVLVTGGTGHTGSHTVVGLLKAGHKKTVHVSEIICMLLTWQQVI